MHNFTIYRDGELSHKDMFAMRRREFMNTVVADALTRLDFAAFILRCTAVAIYGGELLFALLSSKSDMARLIKLAGVAIIAASIYKLFQWQMKH